jgi:hypothetical protein
MDCVADLISVRNKVRRLVLAFIAPGVLQAEAARKELNASLKSHWPDDPIEIFELIREDWKDPKQHPAAVESNYIVFIDAQLEIDWIAEVPSMPGAQKCISLAESIGAQKCNHLPRPHVLHFRRLLGQAIVNAINGEIEQGCQLAEKAAEFLDDRTVELSRHWTLLNAFLIGVIFSLAGAAIVSALRSVAITADSQSWLLAWLSVQGALAGAYLSIVQKAGRGRWDASAGPGAHFIEVFTKLFVGAIFGGFTFVITQSVQAPASLKLLAGDGCSMFLLGSAAGWGERLIPKIISTYATHLNTTKQNEPQSDPN